MASNSDTEGYSMLPDIIWTPGPDMLNSQYGKVIFTNVRESYPTAENLNCTYSIMSGVPTRDDDRVAIFCVGWANTDQVITWVLAGKPCRPNEELTVVFPASQLPPPSSTFYQFCYLSAGEVRGASIPFFFTNTAKDDDHSDDDHSDEDSQLAELKRKVSQLELEKQMLESRSNANTEEITVLRASLKTECDRNRALLQTLHRSELEIHRQIQQHDVNRQNNAVVLTELENELDNKKIRIQELHNIISEKDKIIAYYKQKFGDVNEHAMGGPSQFPPHPDQSGNTDGQFEQQGQVDIGASSGTQRHSVRTSTRRSPFLAALKKTRNYYVTFLSDKADIEQKVFALTCMKLSLVKKLHTLRDRKEYILRLEYRYLSSLERMYGAQYDETGRLLQAVTEATTKRKELEQVALFEVSTIEEVKRRLEINRQNTCTLREKAAEVFNKFLKSYNNSMEHNSGAAQTELSHIQTLYTGLDTKFQYILHVIQKTVNNNFIWN